MRALEDHFSQTKRIVELIIKLVEKDELMQDEQEIAQELNTFFKNTASTLNITPIISLTQFLVEP